VLVRRSSGDVDQLESSGPPIAIVPAYHYAEHTVQFESGDRFLLYTDGLSEVSPDRRRFLGPNGVADMLSLSPSSSAQELVQEILAGAAAFGNEDFRDDVCIIAAVVS
jgi:sigma-B regulation protein RsbU (phosphoserine phosphatase)